MYGYRARIGYTSPPAITEVFPFEFYRMVPRGVTLGIHTLPLVDRTNDEVDRGYEASLSAAHAMARAKVDVLVLGGLPINVSRGFAAAGDMVADLEEQIGVPVLSSFSAQRDAFSAVGAGKVALVQPYGPEHEARFLSYVEKLGAEPLGACSIGAKFIELALIDEERVYEKVTEVLERHPSADTLYLPCPHYATAGLIDRVERISDVRVVTALQAITWRALRRAGVDDALQGFGRLMLLPASSVSLEPGSSTA